MIYLTGDTHGNFERIQRHCKKFKTTKNDLMIILGDHGINYYGDLRDQKLKESLEKLPITFMLIRGNHDMKPNGVDMNILGVKLEQKTILRMEYSGRFLIEQDYPSLLYAIDGEEYRIQSKVAIVYGGAYSVDKAFRLERHALGLLDYKWFSDEQLSYKELKRFYDSLSWTVHDIEQKAPDLIFAHTCPESHIPREMFMGYVDQSQVDNTMEEWFDYYLAVLPPECKWYCGHWHTDKHDGQVRFMYNDIITL